MRVNNFSKSNRDISCWQIDAGESHMKPCKLPALDALAPLPDALTVCSTIDDSGREQVVTELMIRRACEQMDADQHWPFTAKRVYQARRPLPAGGAAIIPFPQSRSRAL